MKQAAKKVMKGLPGGALLKGMSHRMTEMVKDAIFEDSWFEHFGILSIGPIDGHDLPSLIELLVEVKDVDRPLLLHAHTVKGKGFEYTESDATAFHSPKPFEVNDCAVTVQPSGRSFTAAFSDAIIDLMKQDEKVVVATAAMPDGTGTKEALKLFPDRAWDTGICESHTMDMLAGLAKTGQKPFFAVYSTFLQRAFDQTFQEVALQGLPVRLCLDRAGVVGGDGAVHCGFCDISLLRVFPNAVLLAAIDEQTLKHGLRFMLEYNDGLSAIRYPRDSVSDAISDSPPFVMGKAHCIKQAMDTKLAILAYGAPAIEALQAAERVDSDAISVYDPRFAKPVDGELIESLLTKAIPIITVEDHTVIGGFGAAVIEEAAKRKLDTSLITVLGLPDRWIGHSSRKEQLEEAGIDAVSIAKVAERILSMQQSETPVVVTS